MLKRLAVTLLLAAGLSAAFAADPERSVIQIMTFVQQPEWDAPWRYESVQRLGGSGFVIKGKRIMTGGEKDLTNLWWETIARHNGLDPVKDVDLLFSGASSARLAALLSGGIDASVLSPPQTYMAIAQGGTDLGSAAPYLGDFPTMAWHVNDKWGKANPNIVIAFAKANDEAVRYMSDPAHRTEVAQILAKASGLTVDDAIKTWDQSIAEKAFSPDGAASPQAIQHVADILAAAGDLKTPVKPPAAFYDDSYLRAAAL